MRKYIADGFPISDEVFVYTDSKLCGSFGDKKLIPCQPELIAETVRKAVEKAISNRKEILW